MNGLVALKNMRLPILFCLNQVWIGILEKMLIFIIFMFFCYLMLIRPKSKVIQKIN